MIRISPTTVKAGGGQTVGQTHGHRFRNGPLYITRHDGQQFQAGIYTLRAQGTTPRASRWT